MKKVCLINQPAGIGDVFFTQKIVDKFLNEGFNVIYPLEPQLMFINDYIKKENLLFFEKKMLPVDPRVCVPFFFIFLFIKIFFNKTLT